MRVDISKARAGYVALPALATAGITPRMTLCGRLQWDLARARHVAQPALGAQVTRWKGGWTAQESAVEAPTCQKDSSCGCRERGGACWGQRPYGQPAGGGRRRCAHRNMPLSNMRWRLLMTLLLHGWIVGAVNITFQLAEQCALQADCANLCAPAFECTDTSQ